ncbi:MAG TPA: DUF6600 domain-containing protein [Steroidobacteraceae bacterium]|jgi:hypothetical protein|nr:DUF6600 domain-containing protein [Steroidobacteraceae bacterium]
MNPSAQHAATIMSKLAVLLLALSWSGVTWADDADPPGRVARLGLVQDQVSVEPAGLDEWAAADTNRPLTSGDKLWSDADSRAELSIGSAVMRLGSATGFSFLNLGENIAQMQLTAGTLSVHVRSLSDTLEVDTPNVAVSLLGPGDYRVEVNEAGDATVVKVSGGTAEVSGGGQDFAVHPQQRATFSGATELSEAVASLGAPDAFDTWAYSRDRQAQAAQAWSYVAPEVVGAEDLDQNGTWQSTPDEGYVWAPTTVAVGWAPYRFGHWVWISPWGWTWVDDAPWGFAPFHYGRWTTFGGRWCWVPGPRRGHPLYAPALVAWVGTASLAAPGLAGAGRVGWFALGPHEVYVPAYPASSTYVRNINTSNTSVSSVDVMNVYNHGDATVHYVNRNAPGALTAIPLGAFTSAQSVSRNALRLSASEMAAASVNATAPAIPPVKASLLGAGASGPGIRRPSPALLNRVVLAKRPPPPAPVPFAQQEDALRANGGRPLARSELAAMQNLTSPAHARVAPAGGDAGTGMARAARPPAAALQAPPVPVHSRPALERPDPQVPAAPSRPVAPDEKPWMRTDRPPTAVGQPGIPERAPANPAPAGAEAQGRPEPEGTRRMERPVPAAKATAPPLPAAAPAYSAPSASPAAEPAPAVKPAAHSTTPAHPADRGKGK